MSHSCTELRNVWDSVCGSASSSAPPSLEAISGPLAMSVSPSDEAICPMRGMMLPAAITALSTSWSVSAPTSAPSSARPASQFCQDARMLATEPEMVVAASCAVVPVMPISVCTIWMASVMSAKLSMERSAISPWATLTLLASAMSRSISALVPP